MATPKLKPPRLSVRLPGKGDRWIGLGVVGLLLLASQPLTSAVPVRVERWLGVRAIDGEVTFLEQDQRKAAQVGQRLTQVGDGIRTATDSTAQLDVDTGIGFIDIFEQTEMRIRALSVAPDNGRVTHLNVLQGQIRVRVRPFNHDGSELEIETPAGVSGVRGTEFGLTVQPTGQTGTATLEGAVATVAAGETVTVPGGFQNLMVPGEPPTEPVPLRNDTRLLVQRSLIIENNTRYVQLLGRVDPVNTVFVDGEQQAINPAGEFRIVRVATARLQVEIRVITPLGREQLHRVPLL